MTVRSAAFAALALLFAACGTAQPTPSQPVTITLLPGSPQPGSPGSSPTLTPGATPAGPATAEIELTISTGPAEGNYRGTPTGEACTQSANGLEVHYADPAAVDGFTAFDLVLRDAAAAENDASDDFALSVTVSGATYLVDQPAGQGEGTALLERDEGTATLELIATSADGVDIDVGVLCDEVTED
jgi:hypothetical protein